MDSFDRINNLLNETAKLVNERSEEIMRKLDENRRYAQTTNKIVIVGLITSYIIFLITLAINS